MANRTEAAQPESREQANALHARSLVVVMHDHNPVAADLTKMQAGGVTAKVYQLVVDVNPGPDFLQSAAMFDGWSKRALLSLEVCLADIEASGGVCSLALTAADIERAKREGKIAILLGAEGGKLLEGELALLRLFHRFGLRELQLTWAVPNQLVQEGRLTAFGKQVVQECRRLGVIVDVTHIPDRAFYEVMDIAEQPIIVSHGAARAVQADLEDERIQAIARTGGMIGIHLYSTYLGVPPTVEGMVDHVDYISRLVGIDHVGLGVDFFPTEGVWREFQLGQGTPSIAWAVEDLSQIPQVTEALLRRGYAEADIQKVLGLNFLRVCRQVFGQ